MRPASSVCPLSGKFSIECVLPLPVWPYAMTHPWHPCSTESSTGAPTASYTSFCVHVGPSTRSMAKLLDTHAAMRFVTVNVFETGGAVAEIPTSTTSHDVASSESSESEAGLTRAYTRTRSGSPSTSFRGDMIGSRCAALLRMGRRAIARTCRKDVRFVIFTTWRIFEIWAHIGETRL